MTEFEETEFRGPLFHQLDKESHLLWEPGQVFEKVVGTDRASMRINDYFWNLYGYSTHPKGFTLRNRRFSHVWNNVKSGKLLPDFKLNLFIQAKRSEYSSRGLKKLKPNIIGPYWYFEITPHQQYALELLQSELNNDALVVYAAPVFHKQQELYNHTVNQSIVHNSTFPKASSLSGHSKWYFNCAGITGVANPDIEFINEDSLISQIQTMRNQMGEYNHENGFKNLRQIATAIRKVVEAQSNSFQATRFAYESGVIDEYITMWNPEYPAETKDFIQIELFNFLWKLNWLTF